MNYFIYFVIIVSFIDTFSQLPLMSPFAQELGGTSLQIGIVVGMYSFSNMIGNIFAGQFIDQLGRKKIMLTGMIIAGASLIIYSFVNSVTQLIAIRFIHGLGGALLVPAAFAYLGDRTKQGTRGKTMAISGAAIGIAALLGPALGGIIKQQLGIEYVFYLVAALMTITAIFVSVFLPETYQKSNREIISIEKYTQFLVNPYLTSAYLAAFCLMYAKGILAFMLPLKMQSLGFGPAVSGMMFSVFAIMAIMIFILPTNKFSDKVGRIKPMLAGISIIASALILLSLFSHIALIVGSMMFYGVGFAILFPAITALVVDNTAADERGRAFGLFYAFFSLGVVVGPLIVGIIDVTPNLGFIIGAIGVFLVYLLLAGRNYTSKLELHEEEENYN